MTKYITNNQFLTFFNGFANYSFTAFDSRCNRLFKKNMAARFKCFQGKRFVGIRIGGDTNCISITFCRARTGIGGRS